MSSPAPPKPYDLLAQALLREYMHRRNFKQTLKTFDAESPRDEHTIASRNAMGQMMSWDAVGRRMRWMAEQNPPLTYMDQLCHYRLRKRAIRKHGEDTSPIPVSAAALPAPVKKGSSKESNVEKGENNPRVDSSDDEGSLTEHLAQIRAGVEGMRRELAEVEKEEELWRAKVDSAKKSLEKEETEKNRIAALPKASAGSEINSNDTEQKEKKAKKKAKKDEDGTKKEKTKKTSAPSSSDTGLNAPSKTNNPLSSGGASGGSFDPFGFGTSSSDQSVTGRGKSFNPFGTNNSSNNNNNGSNNVNSINGSSGGGGGRLQAQKFNEDDISFDPLFAPHASARSLALAAAVVSQNNNNNNNNNNSANNSNMYLLHNTTAINNNNNNNGANGNNLSSITGSNNQNNNNNNNSSSIGSSMTMMQQNLARNNLLPPPVESVDAHHLHHLVMNHIVAPSGQSDELSVPSANPKRNKKVEMTVAMLTGQLPHRSSSSGMNNNNNNGNGSSEVSPQPAHNNNTNNSVSFSDAVSPSFADDDGSNGASLNSSRRRVVNFV